MGLKENILKKIRITEAAKTVERSLKSTNEPRIDRENAKFILEAAGYKHQHLRDMDMYYKGIDHDNRRIIVLDSEFATFRTSVEDVAKRKSPTVKEMLSFSNIKKILWDEDVITCKRAVTLSNITKEAIELLDLKVTKADIDDIMYHAMASLEEKDTNGILEGISIFSEILGFETPLLKAGPSIFLTGRRIASHDPKAEIFGPLISYNHNLFRICYTDTIFALDDQDQREAFGKFATECESATLRGEDVFRRLADLVKSINRI